MNKYDYVLLRKKQDRNKRKNKEVQHFQKKVQNQKVVHHE